MASVEQRTVSPTPFIDAGLPASPQSDAALERWLVEAVVPVGLSMQAAPDRAVPAAQVFADIRALHLARQAESGSETRDESL